MLFMRAILMVSILLAAAVLVLAGCPQDGPRRSTVATGAADGDSADADVSAGDGAVQEPPSLPPEWPAEFPPIPGAVLKDCQPNAGGPETGYTARLATDMPGEDVLAFYREHAQVAGLEEQNYVSAAESGAAYFHGEEMDFNAGYELTDTGTRITLMYIPVVTAPTVPTGSGLLPPNFPVDILPLYPGADIMNAENLPMDNFLDLHARDASLQDVLDFYLEYYKELGFKTIVEDREKEFLHYVFEGASGGVVLNANTEPDDSTSIHLIYGRR